MNFPRRDDDDNESNHRITIIVNVVVNRSSIIDQ